MFSSVGWGEVAVLLCVALFVVGPDRLPALAADLGRGLRRARLALKGVQADLQAELGPEVGDLDLRALHPRELVRRHLLEDDDAQESWTAAPGRRQHPLGPGEPAPWDPDAT